MHLLETPYYIMQFKSYPNMHLLYTSSSAVTKLSLITRNKACHARQNVYWMGFLPFWGFRFSTFMQSHSFWFKLIDQDRMTHVPSLYYVGLVYQSQNMDRSILIWQFKIMLLHQMCDSLKWEKSESRGFSAIIFC
jgi:hypothetical protein